MPGAARTLPTLVRDLTGRRLPAKEPPPAGLFYVAHICLEIVKRIEQRSIFVLPGGVAFFLLLGLLPAAAAVASLYGLISDPAELVSLSARLRSVLPEATADLIAGGLSRVAEAPRSSLGLSAAVALLMTLMSANWGTKALCEALNIVFDRTERRNYFEFTCVTLLMTTLAAAIVGCYAWVHYHLTRAHLAPNLGPWLSASAQAISIWMLLSTMIGALYRFGPAADPKRPATPILSAGSMTAALAVMIVSWVLSQQLTTSETFVRNFGPLASIAAVVLWTWVIVVMILLGAEIVEIREEEKRQHLTRSRGFLALWR
ncbi:MAG: YhjD/YihY/BrkB family envelope integrity protein [Hyphomicrobium sp.]